MSWDVQVVPEAVIVYFVRCSTCGLTEEFDQQSDAHRRCNDHRKDHEDLWVNNDIGYSLNPARKR